MGTLERDILEGSGYATWMERRETDYCDSVDPVHIDVVDGENVVWARRSGICEEGSFDFYHIGCDCLGPVPRGESEIAAMMGCRAVQKVLFAGANKLTGDRDLFDLDGLMPHFTYSDGFELYLDEEGEEIASRFVFGALSRTVERIDECFGNVRSSVHLKPMVRYMLNGVSGEQIDGLADILAYQGLVVHDETRIMLAADAPSEISE